MRTIEETPLESLFNVSQIRGNGWFSRCYLCQCVMSTFKFCYFLKVLHSKALSLNSALLQAIATSCETEKAYCWMKAVIKSIQLALSCIKICTLWHLMPTKKKNPTQSSFTRHFWERERTCCVRTNSHLEKLSKREEEFLTTREKNWREC